MPAPSKPQIKISALQRLSEEYKLYIDEREALEAKVRTLEQATPVDEYELKRTHQVLDETDRVMAKVKALLKVHIDEVHSLQGLKADEQASAQKALESAGNYVK